MGVIAWLPHLNAAFNFITICLLIRAWFYIRYGNKAMHRKMMLLAFIPSALFLISYVAYHSQVGNLKFAGEGDIRLIYFSFLLSHVIFVTILIPLIPITLFYANKQRFQKHRRLARKTFALWIYVLVSGQIVYLMAFHFYPPL